MQPLFLSSLADADNFVVLVLVGENTVDAEKLKVFLTESFDLLIVTFAKLLP